MQNPNDRIDMIHRKALEDRPYFEKLVTLATKILEPINIAFFKRINARFVYPNRFRSSIHVKSLEGRKFNSHRDTIMHVCFSQLEEFVERRAHQYSWDADLAEEFLELYDYWKTDYTARNNGEWIDNCFLNEDYASPNWAVVRHRIEGVVGPGHWILDSFDRKIDDFSSIYSTLNLIHLLDQEIFNHQNFHLFKLISLRDEISI